MSLRRALRRIGPACRAGGRLALLGGTGLLALAVPLAAAWAQAPATPAAAAKPDDGLGADGFYLEADTVARNDKTHVITAEGDVEARYNGRVVRAQNVVYEQDTGVVTARGKVTVIEADGTVENAEVLTLDKDLQAGFAIGFSAHLKDGSTLAAASTIRRSETINELNKAIYTPCPLCADDPGSKPPTWSIKADQVVEDREHHLVYYKHAVIKAFGVPILYAPLFWHPDPEADATSGLLAPKIGLSKRRGFTYEQPYLWVISPYSDLVVTPQINTRVNPLLMTQYRQRFYSGYLEVRDGYTYDQDIDSKGERFGNSTSRSFILAKGQFDITPKWKWGFTAERASDDLIFDKYDIGDVYQTRGIFPNEDHRLLSQLYSTRQDARSYFSVSAISVQGMRLGDNDRTFPTIAPLVEGRWEPASLIAGGRLRVDVSGVVLTRTQSPLVTTDPGVDSRRASANLDWRSNLSFDNGLRLSPFIQARGDTYGISDLPSTAKSDTLNVNRGLGVVGVDLTMPFIKTVSNGSVLLEPLVQLAASPKSNAIQIGTDPVTKKPIYFNEDSVAFEFDETNLMRPDRSPGFDLYEGGERLNVGGRATVTMDDGRGGSILVGRTFRAATDTVIPENSGLAGKVSDWVVAAQVTPIKGVSLFTRTRIDADNNSLHRIEAGADLGNARASGTIRYLKDDADINGQKQESLEGSVNLNVTKNWAMTFVGSRDLELATWRSRNISVVYHDECARIEVIYEHRDNLTNTPTGRALTPTDKVVIRLTLATLGDTGYSQ